jgi:hypothetical protein
MSGEHLDELRELLLLIIRDGLRAHRSRMVRDYVDTLNGGIEMAYLPPYAPELNPVEYLWAWLKRHALANTVPIPSRTWPTRHAASSDPHSGVAPWSPHSGNRRSCSHVTQLCVLSIFVQ